MTNSAMDDIKALYVDDESGLLEIGKFYLELEGGIKVTTINSAIKALEVLEQEPFDIVISDYHMPGMDGIELLKKINEKFGDKIPFIIFTGRGREAVVIEALNNGATFYLQKGGEPKPQFRELADKIKRAVVSKRLQEKTETDLKRFQFLYDLGIRISEEQDYQKNLQFLVEQTKTLFNTDGVYIALLDINKKNLINKVDSGITTPEYKNLVLPIGEGLGGLVMKTHQGIIIEDYFANKTISHPADKIVKAEGIVSAMAAPIETLGKELGVLYAFSKTKRIFTEKDLDMLFLVSHLAAIQIMYHEQELAEKNSQESLKNTNKKLNLLTSITRHDIGNQLTILSGKLALMRAENAEKYETIINDMETVVKKISSQINFTAIYQNIGVCAPAWQSVSKILKKCLQEYYTKVNLGIQKNPLIELQLQDNTEQKNIQIYADPLFERVVHNLIDNTIRHAQKPDHQKANLIKIDGWIAENKNLIIRYQDNGMGIDQRDKEKIFERGFGKNTGLGLFLIREILSITNIKIKEVGQYGYGACFEITIPEGKYRLGKE